MRSIESYVENKSKEFFDPESAEVYLDSIAYTLRDLGDADYIVDYLENISAVALMYGETNQSVALKVLDLVVDEAVRDKSSKINNPNGFRNHPTDFLLKRAQIYLHKQQMPLSISGLERLARESLSHS